MNSEEKENVSVETKMTPNGEVEKTSTDKPKKKKGKKGIILVIILLLIVIGVVGVVFIYPKFKTDKKSTKASEKKSAYRMSGNSLDNFDLYFLKKENQEKNMIYSPLSIKYALAMLQEGAKGDTKTQITNVIGDYKSKAYPNSEHMSFANAMFIRNTYKDKVREEYTNNLKEKYNAEVILDEFSSPDNINNWVSDKTFKLINNLVDDVSQNDFFLVNALAIDMNWNNQIHCAYGSTVPCINGNKSAYSIAYAHEKLDDDSKESYEEGDAPYDEEDDFYGRYSNGKKEPNKFNGKEGIKGAYVFADFNKYDIVKDLGEDKIKEIIKPEYEQWLTTEEGKNDLPFDQFIVKFIQELKENYGKNATSTDFLVYEDEDVKSFAKDLQEYDGSTLQYVGIMPKKDELTKYIEKTDKDKINKVINGLKEVNLDSFEEGYVTRIRGFIPFFKFEYQLELVNDLKEIGIKDVFDNGKADLTNIAKDGTVINKAIHKANIEFSNDGIKAGAATAMGGLGAAKGPFFEHLFKVPVKNIDVTFDKPYMYLIRDKATGEVWFAGTVYDPIQK